MSFQFYSPVRPKPSASAAFTQATAALVSWAGPHDLRADWDRNAMLTAANIWQSILWPLTVAQQQRTWPDIWLLAVGLGLFSCQRNTRYYIL